MLHIRYQTSHLLLFHLTFKSCNCTGHKPCSPSAQPSYCLHPGDMCPLSLSTCVVESTHTKICLPSPFCVSRSSRQEEHPTRLLFGSDFRGSCTGPVSVRVSPRSRVVATAIDRTSWFRGSGVAQDLWTCSPHPKHAWYP